MSHETVGSLLAVIANSINDGLRVLMFADKSHWGSDEFEQLRILEETLDEAKRDFQELPALVHGRLYYEHDRKPESIEDLRVLCTSFELHAQTFKDWARTGGPINPIWARETLQLRRQLHRAQCRAARRIFNAEQEATTRCLGAFQVCRVQRAPANPRRRHLEELMACNQVGKFERFGEQDVAFVCDFCDGYILWEDLREMPSERTSAVDGLEPLSLTSATSDTPATQESWQATGFQKSDGAEKAVVFAPVAIANHLPPLPGEWESQIVCPFCDEYYYEEQGEEDMEQMKWNPEENGFENMKAFKEHLEWQHSSYASMIPAASTDKCAVM